MTLPLMALAVGAIVAGFVSVPPALGGHAVLEHFLAPSFTAAAGAGHGAAEGTAVEGAVATTAAAAHEEPHISHAAELGLMAFSVMIALIGIVTAYRFYVQNPAIAEGLKERYAGAHSLLYNKYFVDELYNATFIKGFMKSSFGMWGFDRRVVDGAVNGTGWTTVFASWISGLLDRYVVDGAVNGAARLAVMAGGSVRRVQTGNVRNYAAIIGVGIVLVLAWFVIGRGVI